MSTTNTNPDPAALAASVAKLEATLAKVREDHKTEKAAVLAPVRKALGLAEDAGAEAILAALTSKAPDAEAIVAERTAGIVKERDTAREEAKSHREKWANDRRDRELAESLARSGIIKDFAPDALAFARDVFEVTDDGKVQTKSGVAGVIPGASPDQYVIGQLRNLKPTLWPRSQGGGAQGGKHGPAGGDVSCFRDRNVTGIARYADRYGVSQAIREGQRHGIDVSWLTGGGR